MNDEFPQGARFTRMYDNHDIANDTSLQGAGFRFENRWGQEGVDAALVLNFTIDGVPFVYNGAEVADSALHNMYANINTLGNYVIDWWKGLTQTGENRLAFIKSLSGLRHTMPALGGGTVEWISNDVSDRLIAFTRTLQDQQLLCAINVSNKPLCGVVDTNILEEPKVVLNRTNSWDIQDGKLSVELPAYGFVLLVLSD